MELKENIVGKINLILLNIPDNCTDLEKIRYIYMKLGNLFCYDFKIIIDEDLAGTALNYEQIDKYQTCTQITEILNVILRGINKTSKAKVISRDDNRNTKHRYTHVANEVEFTDEVTGEKYKLLLDLTLDLFRIQAGMRTMQFAYTTDAFGSYDIITLKECEQMDRKLGIINDNGYRDEKINDVKKELVNSDISLYDKIIYMWNKLSLNFAGSHEIRQYFIFLLNKIFPNISYSVYNFYYGNVSQSQFASLFIIHGDDDIYLLLDNSLGLVVTDKNNINNMLSLGWKTSSKDLSSVIGYDPNNDKIR